MAQHLLSNGTLEAGVRKAVVVSLALPDRTCNVNGLVGF